MKKGRTQRSDSLQSGKTEQPHPPQKPNEDKSDLKRYIKDEQMIKVLQKKGIVKLFPIQYQTFDLISKGEDVIAKDRTGSGKTLAFALPIIIRLRQLGKFKGTHSPKLLIVLPTRELALQVKDQIFSLKLRDQEDFSVSAIYGGSPMKDQLDFISRGIDIIVATPGRLIDFLNRGAIKLNDLQCICLDEADQMLKIGFKQDIQAIFQFISKAKSSKIQCLFFSATIPDWISQMSDKYQNKSKKFIDMIKDSNVKTSKTVEHYCLKASIMEKQAYVGSLIRYFLKGKSGKVIIFCETKREVQRIANSQIIPVTTEMLHGDIKQFQRQKVFRAFKNGDVSCLVATNVAARGLDFPAIDLIIQMQPPNTTDAYIHRSGRTGRAGRTGVCVTMYSFKEESLMKRIENETKIILQHMNCKDLKLPNQSSKDEERGSRYQNQFKYQRKYEKPDYRGDEKRNRQQYKQYKQYRSKPFEKQQRQSDAESSRRTAKTLDEDLEY